MKQQNPKTLEEYAASLRLAKDSLQLCKKFNIQDNFPILFYGDSEEIFKRITIDFNNSPTEEGMRDVWKYSHDLFYGVPLFNFEPEKIGIVRAQMRKKTYSSYLESDRDLVGQEHSLFITFHPYQGFCGKEWFTVSDWSGRTNALALAIAGFAEYVVRAKLQVRLGYGDIIHIPK